VVGINTALESATGIGFAIPINTARDLLSELLKGGEVATPWLGLQSLDITEALASELELPVNRGMYVVEVIADSPAAQAGIVGSGIDAQGGPVPGGDIVTAIDGQAVVSVDSVLTYLNGKRPGDVVTLTIQRGDSALTVPVTLGEWPESFD
jgi:S1-C subfamily serine protease